jgi:hypothetical protein
MLSYFAVESGDVPVQPMAVDANSQLGLTTLNLNLATLPVFKAQLGHTLELLGVICN